MKKSVLLIVSLFAILYLSARPVDEAAALNVAKNFFKTVSPVSSANRDYTLAYSCRMNMPDATARSASEQVYYIFNTGAGDGFVIISGDDVVTPVLGYSTNRSFDKDNLPPAFEKWMENYKSQILYAVENNLEATDEVKSKWKSLMNGSFQPASRNSVNPLLSTTWNQSPYYNALCPGGSVTGCVATAMAQIMKYWAYPANGTGFHSYNTQNYGTLSANFGSTTYNWAGMPNNVTSSNTAVATLMYQCGVSVEMNYSPTESGAWVIAADNPVCAENSYKTYFGYDPATIQGLRRSSYTDVAWKNLLKTDLNSSRPIQYVGSGTQGGHTWVCDGYDANDLFHMNWGWGGLGPDGFYDLDALNPPALGTGGGAGGFNSNEEAVIGIKPVTGGGGTTTGDIALYSSISINPNPIGFGQAFTVNADVVNNGTSNFTGTYCAALFTTTGAFITYIDSIVTGSNPLPPTYHYNGGLTFSSAGLLTVPGTYEIGIFYKPTGGNWLLAANTNYTNPVNVTITGPSNPLNLYSAITPSPATFVQGQAASVNVNFVNNNSSTYTGTYEADLYDLNGNYVETIGSYNETTGLPAGYTYNSPYITFSTSAITASPGTYILAISEYESGNWYLAGTTYYPNPDNIQVIAPALSPDIYEVNNTQGTAYTLPLTWTNNASHKVTTGSNIHINTDVDFYKINLPAGYNYTITPRANDSYSSADGNTYTDDVLWSYNTGSGWSSTYDDVMPGSITMNGGGTVTFQVASYFPGNTGTYVLDLHLTRTATTTGLDVVQGSSIQLYPNPASDIITIRSSDNASFDHAEILNVNGQVVSILPNGLSSGTTENIDIASLPDGVYFVVLSNSRQKYFSKFIISR